METIQISIGRIEFRRLIGGQQIIYRPNGLELRVGIDRVSFAEMVAALAEAMNPRDPPEARELVWTKDDPDIWERDGC